MSAKRNSAKTDTITESDKEVAKVGRNVIGPSRHPRPQRSLLQERNCVGEALILRWA